MDWLHHGYMKVELVVKLGKTMVRAFHYILNILLNRKIILTPLAPLYFASKF